ncbi:MAG: accessory Sec system glycosylation chaperone GtfB, partial [Candidatus Weimeria sp.]
GLLESGASPGMVHPLGFIYDFSRKNNHGHDVLICTNSDQIEELDVIVTSLPQLNFHIAAVTEMSERLMAFSRYPNVRLYPVVKKTAVNKLFLKCDLYFDINYGMEILSSVERAFLNNMLILSFKDTVHRRRYTADCHIFSDFNELVSGAEAFVSDPKLFDRHLELQREGAMSQTAADYQRI